MKNILLSLFGLIIFISCGYDNNAAKVENKRVEIKQKVLQSGNVISVNYSSEKEKKNILDNLLTEYLSKVYLDDDFDSRYVISGAVIEDHKKEQALVIKYDIINLGDMTDEELVFFVISSPIDYIDEDLGSLKTEKLMHYCNGGASDGRSIVVNRPTETKSAIKYGNQISTFVNDCLDGEGCLEVCVFELVLMLNEDSIKFKTNDDKLEYLEILNESRDLLFEKLKNI